MSFRTELIEDSKKANKKTLLIVSSASLFAFLFWIIGQWSDVYRDLAASLNHHACSTNGSFVAFAIGISQITLPLCIIPHIGHHWRFVSRTVNEMTGHLTLASLGFAVIFWFTHLRLGDVGVGAIWLLGGWFCVFNSFLFEKEIDSNEPTKIRKSLAPIVLYANIGFGVVMVTWGVVAGGTLKPIPGCLSYFH